jgi:long-subunit acyl-CoA synthetase (AMP-forming)
VDFCVQDYGSRGSPSKSPVPKASKHSSIIILTSGTTGTPKRGESEHSAIAAPIGRHFVASAVQAQRTSAVVRATVVVVSFLQELFEPAVFGPT